MDLKRYTCFTLPAEDTRNNINSSPPMPPIERMHLQLIQEAQARTDTEDPLNLNYDQKIVYDAIVSSLNVVDVPRSGRVVFADGTGKTYLFNSLLYKVRREGEYAIAALLLDGGRTSHSTFSIPVDIDSNSVCKIKPNRPLASIIEKTKLVIWDESSMTSRDIFDAVDRTFRDIMSSVNPRFEKIPFSGILMVFGGDFRQILPVIPKASRIQIVKQSINRSKIWSKVTVFKLRINMRVMHAQNTNDPELQQFANYLLRVGDGAIQGYRIEGNASVPGTVTDFIPIPRQMVLPENTNLDDLISVMYPFMTPELADQITTNMLINSVIMIPKNDDVKLINKIALEKFPGDKVKYLSADTALTQEEQVQYPQEYLNSIENGSLPPHEL